MRFNISYKKIALSLLFVLISMAALLYFLIPKDPYSEIRSALNFVNQKLKIGTSNFRLNKTNFIRYGYGNCTDFVLLFREELANRGYASRAVGIISKNNGGHDLLEIRFGDKWILSDPMNNVLYANSLFEILLNPILANTKAIENPLAPLPKLINSEFFNKTIAANFGDFYYNDKYRFVEISKENGFINNKNNFSCPVNSCTWKIELPATVLDDETFRRLPFVAFQSDDKTIKFSFGERWTHNGRYLPWRLPPTKGVLKFTTSSTKKHSFTMSVLSSPIKDLTALKMRISPAIIVFRDVNLDFFGANLICNNSVVWQKQISNNPEEYHNALFLPDDKNEKSAWSPLKNIGDLNYRSTVMGLSSNEPRIRLQPFFINEHNSHCKLLIRYRSKGSPRLLLFEDYNRQIVQLGKLKPCKNKVCKFVYHFKPSILSAWSPNVDDSPKIG